MIKSFVFSIANYRLVSYNFISYIRRIMPILKNAKKALRVSEHKAAINRQIKSKAKNAVDAMKKSPSQAGLTLVFRAVDRAVKNNIFHKNKGARLKSKLSKLLPVPKKTKVVKA